MRNFFSIGVVMTLFFTSGSCKKFVEVPPPSNQLTGATVYESNGTAAAAVSGIYQTLVEFISGPYNLSGLLSLSADEFSLYPNADPLLNSVYTNSILNTTEIKLWDQFYNIIYQSNSAIEGITASLGVSSSMKDQLVGEAKCLRGFSYLYLTSIYGDVPLITTSNYMRNANIPRTPKHEIHQLIISDLRDAQNLLSNDYLKPNGSVASNRVRPNKGTATALLARAYLYQQKWDSAEIQATAVINDPNYILASDLNTVFVAMDNTEAIWQLEELANGANTLDGEFFLKGYYNGGPSSVNPILLRDDLVNSFETGDLRRQYWTISATFDSIVVYFPISIGLAQLVCLRRRIM